MSFNFGEQKVFKGDINVTNVFIGFIILISAFVVGGFIFSRTYKYFSKELIPIIYALFVLSGIILSNLYMLFQYKCIPLFIKKSVKNAVMTAVGGVVLLWILNVFFSFFYSRKADSPFQSFTVLPSLYFYIGMIMITSLIPFFEEILMRGFFFEILKRRWSISISLLITLLFSTITHSYAGIGLIAIIIYNIVLTFLYLEGGLVASILAHMFVNYYVVYGFNS